MQLMQAGSIAKSWKEELAGAMVLLQEKRSGKACDCCSSRRLGELASQSNFVKTRVRAKDTD
jgi:hypothetical protein